MFYACGGFIIVVCMFLFVILFDAYSLIVSCSWSDMNSHYYYLIWSLFVLVLFGSFSLLGCRFAVVVCVLVHFLAFGVASWWLALLFDFWSCWFGFCYLVFMFIWFAGLTACF